MIGSAKVFGIEFAGFLVGVAGRDRIAFWGVKVSEQLQCLGGLLEFEAALDFSDPANSAARK